MDVQTIDQQYQQLQGQSQQTIQALQTLGGKLQAAAQGGDQQAREWFLDLRELAIAFKAEQDQMSMLLQAIHGFVSNQAQNQGYAPPQQQGGGWGQSPSFAQPQQPGYPQAQPGFAPQAQGGMLGGFLNSGFGRAIEMGAGFGIGDEIINKIF
jgi:cell fate (sporulation/competence/biofilm development) regulator YlbF (YheA/YmcA/DUF963 family)